MKTSRIFFGIFIALFTFTIQFSYCQNVSLHSQTDVDNFNPNTTIINGKLIIDDGLTIDKIIDLSNLSKIKTITGSLVVRNTKALSDLNGFSSLESVGGYIFIYDNESLLNVDGLENLLSIGGSLEIDGNEFLETLGGFKNIKEVNGNLKIQDNAKLKNLDGLSKIERINGYLIIKKNIELKNFEGLSNISSGVNFVEISYNDKLVNIEGLKKIKLINGHLILSNNKQLPNINGLNNIVSIDGNLIIASNPVLQNLDGFSSLESIGDYLYIYNNISLKNIDGLKNLTSIGGYLSMSSNNSLINLEGFKKLNTLGSYFYLYHNNSLLNISGLSNLVSINGDLTIWDNDILKNLDGLNNIISVNGNLIIYGNDALTNLNALNKIGTIAGDLSISYNSKLTNCCGIQDVISIQGSIGGQIEINDNPSECSSQQEVMKSICGMEISIRTYLSCEGDSNGSIQINVVGYDTIPFYYKWEEQNSGLTGSGKSNSDNFLIENLASGIYDVTVTTPAPDSAIKKGIVLSDKLGSVFEILEITTTNSSNGSNNGSIYIRLGGGTPPYSFVWSGSQSGSKNGVVDDNFTISSLVHGEYDILVSDDAGNQKSASVSLLDETLPVFPCTEPMDIVILNDVSGSVDEIEYEESKRFFVDFINAANIGTGDNESRAAIIEWSSYNEQKLAIPMTGDSLKLQKYITFERDFSEGTAPHSAMQYGKNYLESVGRSDVSKVLVLSTDAETDQISPSLIALADGYKAEGYHIITIAFDNAYSDEYTRDILRQVASIDLLAPGASAYSQLGGDLAEKIVNIYLCPIDPGSTATAYFNRDGAISIVDAIIDGNCPYPDNVELVFSIEALRELSLPSGTKVSFYYNDPELFGATKIFTWTMPCALPVGETDTFSVVLPIQTPANIFAVLNDDGSMSPPISFPITEIEELAYSNNIDNMEICLSDEATLQALKYTSTPMPVCDTTVIYTIDVCNISNIDAYGVSIIDLPPPDFALIGTVVNDNGCAIDQGGIYDIPAGCCVSLTLTYNAAKASNGYYGDQDVDIDGATDQQYIDFDGSTTTAEDVIINDSLDCPSTVIEFSKSVNRDSSCDDAFLVYTFTINNEMNIPLQGLVFRDVLPVPCQWTYKPYQVQGMSIGNVDISGEQAQFVIDEVEANTVAVFSMDASLQKWDEDGELSNFATLENVPDIENGGYSMLTTNTVSTIITASPEINIPDTIEVESSDTLVRLEAILSGNGEILWTSTGDGNFRNDKSAKTVYEFGANDLKNKKVLLSMNMSNNCGEINKDVVVIIKQCSFYVLSYAIAGCDNHGTFADSTDDTFNVLFKMGANNPGVSSKYIVSQGNKTYGVFDYGVDQKIVLPADGKTNILRFSDIDNKDCFVEREASQHSCSPECEIIIDSLIVGDCDDNGTPADTTDDTYIVTFKLNALNTGTNAKYKVLQGNNILGTFDYGVEQTIIMQADGITDTLIFQDSEKGTCIVEKEVSQNSCSEECRLIIDSLIVGECNDNGTPADSTDDTYEITFSVSGVNSGSTGKYFVWQGDSSFGSFDYGQVQAITLTADGIVDTLIFKDSDKGTCIIEKEVFQHSCSEECQLILDSLIVGDCNDNGTSSDSTDDTYEIIFKISAKNPGSSGKYTVIQNDEILGTFKYNEMQYITLPANGNLYSLLFEDTDNKECYHEEGVMKNNCSTEKNVEDKIYIPNIFTPDGDLLNDYWKPTILDSNINILRCYIYDRWGELIFSSEKDNNFYWDGNFKGEKALPGVYTYLLQYTNNNKNDFMVAGSITLIR